MFQKVFGAENSIVGVIFAIMMSASMVRDLTSTPFKHLLAQSTVLVLMAAAACLVVTLNPWIALPINFIMIFLILYLYTYEYSGHLYFPYILSYLFLIFISPSSPEQLPKRIIAMVTGASNTDRCGQAVHILSLIRQWNTGEPGRCPKEYPPPQPHGL